MPVTVPSDGDPITSAWGAEVSRIVNAVVPLYLSSDQSTNSTSFSDIGDMTIPVESGKVYNGQLLIRWQPQAANMGPSFAINHPGGTVMLYTAYYIGTPGGTVNTWERAISTDTQTGEASGSGTNVRLATMNLYYACSSDGTLAVRFKRNGTSGAPGITVTRGSGGLLLVTS